jgi:hypothetical protein
MSLNCSLDWDRKSVLIVFTGVHNARVKLLWSIVACKRNFMYNITSFLEKVVKTGSIKLNWTIVVSVETL